MTKLSTVALFAGIGGIEVGLEAKGHDTLLFSEIEPPAQRVLQHHFDGVPLVPDVRDLRSLPKADLVTAGFPCQDLSQAGRTAGINGTRSGLVGEVFRLMEPQGGPTWLMLENVPFMLQLERGEGMRYLTDSLTSLGFRWAYRVVDTRSFGLPQRRRRVILLASRTEDPRPVLFTDEAGEPPATDDGDAYGFYWTEGVRGLGWACDAIPTIKGGSSLGIPSPPAIWMKNGQIVTPDIRDAERLQGFEVDWTLPAVVDGTRHGARWKLVGNAVSTPVSAWVGGNLARPPDPGDFVSEPIAGGSRWPSAAWGDSSGSYRVELSEWPVSIPMTPISDFLRFPAKPLSERAAAGFLNRTEKGRLRFVDGFLADVERHRDAMARERERAIS